MAELKNTTLDIELSHLYSNASEKAQAMPRMDQCHNCGHSRPTHVDGKCLFVSTMFKPLDKDYTSFRTEFMQWVHGQKIEDALCNIVYELTRGDR